MTKQIDVLGNADDLAIHAAQKFIRSASNAIRERGKFVVALVGGSTPEATYRILARPDFAHLVDWSKTFVFFGDERFVPHNDRRSNLALANKGLLSHVGIPIKNIFPIPVEVQDVHVAAKEYGETIKSFFHGTNSMPVFDLIWLGLGDDGHTASLFPHNPSLAVTDEWIVGSKPGVLPPPVDRITFTLPLINAALEVSFLVAGEKKARIVGQVIEGAHSIEDYPAVGVNPTAGKLTWMLDRAAASLLRSRDE
jgi:6-phosphogluconolactonase